MWNARRLQQIALHCLRKVHDFDDDAEHCAADVTVTWYKLCKQYNCDKHHNGGND